MSTWYKTGTIDVTNGSAAVTGTGTAFVANVNVGDALQAPDGRAYEITGVGGDTALTIAPAYLGATAAAQAVRIQPTRALTSTYISSATELLAMVQSYIDGALSGKFADGSAGAPALTFASDPDTGLFRKAANRIALSTGGTERAAIGTATLELNLPLTGTAVQSGPEDATPGRLLTQGAFGVGADTMPDTADLNLVRRGGMWKFGSSAANRPFSQGGAVLVMAVSPSRTLQIADEHDTGRIATRYISESAPSSGVWTAWREIYHGGTLLGAVSQSGGVPTGAVIETGENANGTYTRWADGTQLCSHLLTTSSSADTSWTFPAVFAAASGIRLSVCPREATSAIFGSSKVPSTTVVGVNAWNTSAARVAASVSLIAVGRWF